MHARLRAHVFLVYIYIYIIGDAKAGRGGARRGEAAARRHGAAAQRRGGVARRGGKAEWGISWMRDFLESPG